jgi:hypothetical protein
MQNDERRILELTAILEEVLECFEDLGDIWVVNTYDGLERVSEEVVEVIERAQAVLYNEGCNEDLFLDADEDDLS